MTRLQRLVHFQVPRSSIVSKVYPESLSVIEMLKLGGGMSLQRQLPLFIPSCLTLSICMEWSIAPVTVEFRLADKSFACGGFREAFKVYQQ